MLLHRLVSSVQMQQQHLTQETQSNHSSRPQRDEWSSSFGFIMATAGSAVGLGNLWGFAYRASSGGGAVFVVLFIAIIITICLPALIAEMVMGRSTGQSPLLAPQTIGGKRWAPMGWWLMLNCLGILSYYSVIMGWTLNSIWLAAAGDLPMGIEAATSNFQRISSGSSSLFGHIASITLAGFVVSAGVKAGIERLSLYGIPLLFVMLIGLMVWAGQLPDAMEGYREFLLKWDASKFFDITTLRNAFTQAFFSLGIGVGVISAYASYLHAKNPIPKEASWVAGMDTSVGLMAGCVTFPLVASAGLQSAVSDSNVGSLFIAIPSGLASMGGTGRAVAGAFFILVYIAGLTSLVSILEAPVSCAISSLGLSRRKAVWSVVTLCLLLGIPAALDVSILETMDAVFAGFGMISGGLLVVLLMGRHDPERFNEDLRTSGSSHLLRRLLLLSLRWLAPAVISIGLIVSVADLHARWVG